MSEVGRASEHFSREGEDSETFHRLLQQSRAGSNRSLGELLERFRNYLQSTAAASLDSSMRPKVGASDIVQESMIDAQRSFEEFHGQCEAEFRGWLKRVLVNNLLNQYRAWKRTQKRQLSREVSIDQLGSSRHPALHVSSQDPLQRASLKEQVLKLEAALMQLTDDQRQVIVLRHREQLNFRQIGTLMGRSPDAARMLWYRAFEQLASEIGRSPHDK